MEPRLRDFFSQLIRQAINSGIMSMFWKMPFILTVVVVLILIAVAVYFGLY